MQWFKFVEDNVVTLAGYTDRKEMGRTMFLRAKVLILKWHFRAVLHDRKASDLDHSVSTTTAKRKTRSS
jgi:hypothetical protein